ncbi:metallophosphoesterase [Paenibacillus mesophilus]|uniref:metallophosphoesterase family protein n=1 Tax=Paenibacillus mesophilus TaxID=2582849 RepID=UPI00110DC07C|nr:metallophosphoesterase family protein [Paenibacillus mesophilus]TMV52742.1 metallophosphoesterase [Paenibacillus mesophilus]
MNFANGLSKEASMRLPDYLQAEMKEVLDRCRSEQNEETVSFVFITDIHHSKGGNQLYTVEAIRQLAGQLRFDAIVCGGDHSQNGPKSEFMASQMELMDAFHAVGLPFFPLKGNHDDNSIHDHYHDPDQTGNVVFPGESYELYIRRIESLVSHGPAHPDGLYYYYDVPGRKMRMIVLNCIDIPYKTTDKGGLQYKGQWKYAFSNEQLNWMAHVALDFSAKADSRDWSVVVFSHVAIGQEEVFGADHPVAGEKAMWGVIDAYRTGSAYRFAETDGDFAISVEADFSKSGPGIVTGCFFGHVHFDQVIVRDGIPLISTLNATTNRDFEEAPERIRGTRSETAFDVVTIDNRHRTMHLTRFGPGGDRRVRFEAGHE